MIPGVASRCLAAVVGSTAPGGDATAAALDGYIRSLLQIRAGYVDVEALDLPDEFLRRVAGRSIRLRFRQQFRQIADDPAAVATAAPAPSGVTVLSVDLPPAIVEQWRSYDTATPGLRGFRAPVRYRPGGRPMHASPGEYRAAATYVARHLARDGLIATTMNVMRHVQLDWLTADRARLNEQTLRDVGIPVDLLAMFSMPDRTAADAIAAWYDYGAPGGSIPLTRTEAVFRFRPSRPGFVVAPRDGTMPVAGVRLQLNRDGFERGPGDGSARDLVGQLMEALPDSRVWLSAQDVLVEALVGGLAVPADRLVVVPTALPVSTWAHDGAGIGLVADGDRRRPVTLVPRFASGGEATTRFIPGDAFVFETVGAAIGEVAQSCLLFQGGNLLPVVDPVAGELILLIGEREVYRNRALGLTSEQVLDAFRIEFGVDRCEVLPAVSFHLDMELTMRNRDDVLVACLPDDLAAASIVITAAIEALSRGGAITAEQTETIRAATRSGSPLAAMRALNDLVADYYDPQGRLTPLFTTMFASTPGESGAANVLRFLVAMDILTADTLTPSQLQALPDEHRRYLQTFRRRTRDRAALAARLRAMGMTVANIPSMSDEEASIDALNGIHLPGAYLMPAYGGLYADVDATAAAALSRVFGPGVEIRPVRSAALQAAYGGPGSASSIYPALPDTE